MVDQVEQETEKKKKKKDERTDGKRKRNPVVQCKKEGKKTLFLPETREKRKEKRETRGRRVTQSPPLFLFCQIYLL